MSVSQWAFVAALFVGSLPTALGAQDQAEDQTGAEAPETAPAATPQTDPETTPAVDPGPQDTEEPEETASTSEQERAGVARIFTALLDNGLPFPLAPEAQTRVDTLLASDTNIAHWFQIIEVPLVRNPVSLDQESDNLWVKGGRPENRTLARVTFSPVESVAVAMPDSEEPLILNKAVRDARYGVSENAPEGTVRDGKLFCGAIPSPKIIGDNRLACLLDADGDGSFERLAPATSERRGLDPLAISMMLPSLPLETPLPYVAASEDQREKLEAEIINCEKDWDRPRYNFIVQREATADDAEIEKLADALLAANEELKFARETIVALVRERYSNAAVLRSSCTRGDALKTFKGQEGDAFGKGHILASLDGMVISIGKKKAGAPVTLIGDTGADRSYRIEERSLTRAFSGLSAKQKRIATRQRFERPSYLSAGPIRLGTEAGALPGELFSLPFQYGYRARLMEKEAIRTLLTSRSLDAGTEFYGLPMRKSITTTYGYGYGSRFGSGFGRPTGPQRGIDLQLNWCTPVAYERERRIKGTRDRETYTAFEATCISQIDDQFTIVKNNSPGYAVTSMRHEADISTNDGKPDLERLGPGTFGEPLRLVYRVDKIASEEVLTLIQEIWVGDVMTGTRTVLLPKTTTGVFTYRNAGAEIVLSAKGEMKKGEVPDVLVQLVKPVREGSSVNMNAGRTSLFGL